MKNILIISATSNSNFTLAKKISELINEIGTLKSEIINIEKIMLPVFNPSTIDIDKKNNFKSIVALTDRIVKTDAFVLCIPEYNGNIPPVFANVIAWVSVSTDYWKDGFIDKYTLIASSSGGEAQKLQISLKNQMEHLGCKVYNKNIIINSRNSFESTQGKNILNEFIKVL